MGLAEQKRLYKLPPLISQSLKTTLGLKTTTDIVFKKMRLLNPKKLLDYNLKVNLKQNIT
jgi:hypothetical protein